MSHKLKKLFFISSVYQIFTIFFGLSCSYLLSKAIEKIINNTSPFYIFIETVCVIILGTIMIYITYRLNYTLKSNIAQRYKQSYVQNIIDLKVKINDSGEVDIRLNKDVETIFDYFTSYASGITASIIVIIICFSLCFYYSPQIAVILSVLSLLQLIPPLVYEKWAKEIYMSSQESDEEYCSWLNEGFDGISTIKSYRQEDYFFDKIKQKRKALTLQSKRENTTATVEDIIASSIKVTMDYGIYIVFGIFILHSKIEISVIPAVIVIAQFMFSSMDTVGKSYIYYVKYREAKKRLSVTISNTNANMIDSSRFFIEIKNLNKYYDDKHILKDINFNIMQGEKILLQGKNGSGQLLCTICLD